jgi:hypothetical protein
MIQYIRSVPLGDGKKIVCIVLTTYYATLYGLLTNLYVETGLTNRPTDLSFPSSSEQRHSFVMSRSLRRLMYPSPPRLRAHKEPSRSLC